MNNETIAQKQKTLKEAETRFVELTSDAENARAEAEQTRAEFERSPDDAAFVAKSVAEQKAKNAALAAENFQSEVAAAREALKSAETDCRRIELKASRSELESQLTSASAAIVNSFRQLDLALVNVRQFNVGLDKQAIDLGGAVNVIDAMGQLERRLNAELSDIPGTVMRSRTEAARVIAHQQTDTITIEVKRLRDPSASTVGHHDEQETAGAA